MEGHVLVGSFEAGVVLAAGALVQVGELQMDEAVQGSFARVEGGHLVAERR